MDRELIGPCLDELVAAEGVVRELVPGEGGDLLPAVYLVAFHRAEQSLATGLLALLNSRRERLPAFAAVDWGKAWRWLHARTGQDLAPEQQEAAQLALTQKVAVLTGGPGCGKSFTVRSIVELATANKAAVVLAAPTGRAAKRLAELTGHPAATVHRLLELLNSGQERLPAFTGVDWPKALGWLAAQTGQDLAPGQQEAAQLALTQKVAVLTGGPGCGKSFTVRSIVELATAKNATVMLAAPTGRAAKRLAELTGHQAATVHRLLELQPGGDPKYDRDHPLAADLVVVDESSMMDVILANKLVKAIPPGAHLLLVGDVDQLPSVGAGEVLRDLLAASTIPRVRLTQIFRQARQSGIVVNAHRINHGQPPQLTGFGDFYWFACEPPEDSGLHPAEETARLVVDIVARRIPAKFGLDPARDIQVLTPTHRGPAGAGNLNALLQQALTPHRPGAPEKWYGGRVFRTGDKVTQLRNNYDKGKAGIFNGTVGVVTGLSLHEQALTVLTDEDEQVDYDFGELD